jgi:hypothetical protein
MMMFPPGRTIPRKVRDRLAIGLMTWVKGLGPRHVFGWLDRQKIECVDHLTDLLLHCPCTYPEVEETDRDKRPLDWRKLVHREATALGSPAEMCAAAV